MKPFRLSLFRAGLPLPAIITCTIALSTGLHAQTIHGQIFTSADQTLTGDHIATGDGFIATTPNSGSLHRNAVIISGNHILTLGDGSSLAVQNDNNLTTFLRVGYHEGETGTLVIEDGASLSVGQATRYANFHVGEGEGSNGFVNQTGGDTLVKGSLNIGVDGGTGTYTISGGTLTIDHDDNPSNHTSLATLGLNLNPEGSPASNGSLLINGGLVHVTAHEWDPLNNPGEYGSVGLILGNRDRGAASYGAGDGTITQTNGILRIDNHAALYLSSVGNGTYNLSGGTLEIGGNSLRAKYGNGPGTYDFNFSGGSIKVIGSDLVSDVNIDVLAGTPAIIDTDGLNATLSGDLVGDGVLVKTGLGNLNLSGDNNLTGQTYVIGGAMNQTGGASTIRYFATGSGAGTQGNFSITGGSLDITSALQVGDWGGTSTFTINGGAVSVGLAGGASFNVGNQGGTGTVNIQSGSLTLGQGLHSLGRMDNQAPGTPAGNGTINLSGGLLEIVDGGSLILGDRIAVNTNTTAKDAFGSGTLNQSGGILRVTDGGLFLSGHGATGTGTYNLSGGTLEIGGDDLRARYNNSISTYDFNFSGGSIKVIGSDLVSDVNIDVLAGTPAIIDTNGLNATLSGDLTGNGILVKGNTGNLNLSGDNNLTGEFYVVGGAVNQTGGDSIVRYLAVGSGAGANGDFSITGGSLEITNSLQVGDFGGSSTFTIDGGDVFVGSVTGAALNLGNQGGNGTLNLESGSLTLGYGQHSTGRMDNRPPGTPAGTGNINVSGGLLEIIDGGSLILGDRIAVNSNSTAKDAFGSGTLNQTGGIVRVSDGALFLSGHGATGTGTYNLNGGALEIGGDDLRGRYNNSISTYNFNLGGGTLRVIGSDLTSNVDINVVDNDPSATATASYIDTNGLNATLSGVINGEGVLVKTGAGTLNLTGNVSRSLTALSAAAGTIDHQSGITSVDTLLVGSGPAPSNGNFTLSGGELNVTGANSSASIGVGAGSNTGTLSITGGTLNLGVIGDPSVRVEFYVGAFGTSGTGTVNHSGGVVNKLSDLGTFQIGNQATGIYNLSGTGVVNIYGPNSMVLGRSVGTNAGDGTLNVSGGSLNFYEGADLSIGGAQASEPIGLGNGTVNQTGGTVLMGTGSVVIGQRGNGSYNLNGGVLEVGGANRLRQGTGGTASFSFGGGTLRVGGSDLTSSLNMSVASGDSKIDTNGLNASLSGNLTGGGLIRKVGTGNLNLSGNNDLSGSFYVEGGTVNQTAGDSTVRYLAVGTGAGNTGNFSITSGSLEVTNALQVGDWGGSSTFTIDGGSVTVGSEDGAALNVGNQGGNGTVNLESGSLTLGYGQHSTGRMNNQAPGTAAGFGTINVNGGLLEVIDNGMLILGDLIAVNTNSSAKDAFGSGELNQTDGVVRVSQGTLFVAGFGASASGTYNLNGGTLEIGGASLVARYNNTDSQSNFNMGGGTLEVIGSKLVTDVEFKLTNNTTSTFNTSTHGASVASINGTGELIKTGQSDLEITGASSIGKLTVNEGNVIANSEITVGDLHLEMNSTFSGSGFALVTGTFTGTGNLRMDTRVTGTFSVGNSPGAMELSNALVIADVATFSWDLVGDTSSLPGTNYDQITLTLGGSFEMEDGSIFEMMFDGTDFTAAFWGEEQSWLVVDGDGSGDVTLGDVTMTSNTDYSSYGQFALAGSGDDLTLTWTPTAVPEPSTAALLLMLAPLAAYRRRARAEA